MDLAGGDEGRVVTKELRSETGEECGRKLSELTGTVGSRRAWR